MMDGQALILDALGTRKLTLPVKKLPEDPCAMEVIAHAYAVAKAEDAFKPKLAKAVLACEYDGLYKHVVVNMRGVNGNVFVVLGTVKKALQRAKADPFHVQVFMHRAMSGAYEDALATCAKWVTIVDRRVEQGALSAFKRLPKED